MAIIRVDQTLRSRFVQFFARLEEPDALPPGWRILDIESEQGISLVFVGPTGHLIVELDRRDLQRWCFVHTERFNVYYSLVDRDPREGQSLRDDEQRIMAAVVDCVRAHERELVLTDAVASSARTYVRELQVDRVLVPEAPQVYYLNAYVGCMIGCSFCYAGVRGDTSRWLEGLPKAPWGQWVDVKVNLAEVLRRECASCEPGVVRMSPIITDPYQPIERKYRLTRQALEVLLDTGFIPVILTRGSLVERDIDLLSRFPRAAVGFSIPSDDDGIRALLEPGAESVATRLESLRRLREAGIATYAMLQPLLPLDTERYIDLVAPLVHTVYVRPVCTVPGIRELLGQIRWPKPLAPGWEQVAFAELRAGFEARGVAVNPPNDPWSFLG